MASAAKKQEQKKPLDWVPITHQVVTSQQPHSGEDDKVSSKSLTFGMACQLYQMPVESPNKSDSEQKFQYILVDA